MKTLDIIKALPMDILNRYDYLKPEQKLSIDQLAWETYDSLYDEHLQENIALQYVDVKNGKEHFDDEFYKKALAKTDYEMMQDMEASVSQADLSIARKAMEQIMKEIHAAKGSPVKKNVN
jgi:hypothetical protein